MILIGQYDSPFVRRVGIAMVLYGLKFEQRPWSAFGDADRLRALNPLTRVPTLVLADGDVLIDSASIIDYLDGLMPEAERLLPVGEPERHRALKITSLATGLADKAVALFYEQRLHATRSDLWVERCQAQIAGVLQALEADRAGRYGSWWFGDRLGHADIAAAATLRFITDVHPGLFPHQLHPALARHARECEALAVFQEISQPFIAPA